MKSSYRSAMVRISAAVCLGLGALAVMAAPVRAATTWYVAPSGNDGATCTTATSPCQHIATAVAKAASGDTISLAAGLYGEHLSLMKTLTLTGSSAATTIIDGGMIATVVTISQQVTAALVNVTIRHGSSQNGGGIVNFGTLHLANSVVTSNQAVSPPTSSAPAQGGGIWSSGTLFLNNSIVTQNTACYGAPCAGQGAGIYMMGTTNVIDSTISSNKIGDGSAGAGIYDSNARLGITLGTINGNTGGDQSSGIGLYSDRGTVQLAGTTMRWNENSRGWGGAINNFFGALTIITSTLSGNVTGDGGGAIDNYQGSVTVRDSTIANNRTGFDIGGGGIENDLGTVILTSDTFSGNSAPGNGGGVYNNGGTMYLRATLLANNSTGSVGPDCAGPVVSQGGNLVGNDTGCVGMTAGINNDLAGTASAPLNVHLGPLADNGGPTQTMALLTGSPAITAVPPADCRIAYDQRGLPRPGDASAGGFCDIGAFETQN